MNIKYLNLLFLLSLSSTAIAQDSTSINYGQAGAIIDQDRRAVLNTQGFGGLVTGTGLTITNPELEYEAPEEKAYLDPKMQLTVLTLRTGHKDTLMARLRVLDQVVEVSTAKGDFDVNPKLLYKMEMADGRQFVSLFPPLIEGDPLPVVELLAQTDDLRLLKYYRAEWQEPARARTSYDNDNYKKRLYREDLVYVDMKGKTYRIRKMKNLISYLPPAQQIKASSYANQERLKNTSEDYVSLLKYLAEE